MKEEPLSDVSELFHAHRVIHAVVASLGQPGMLIQPGDHGIGLVLGDHGVVFAKTVEHGDVQIRETIICGRCRWYEAGCKEA